MKIKELIKSDARKKVVHFFNANPSSIDTLKGITTWTGLDSASAIKALEELVKAGILIPHRLSSTVGYAYAPPKKIARDIKKYFQAHSQKV